MNKNNKKIEIIAFIVLVALILGLALTLYLRRNSISNVNKVLANKYDEVKCVDEDCDYVVAYNKSKNMYYVYDSYGVKLSKFEKSNSKMLYDVAANYLLFKNVRDDGEIKNYYMTKLNGKEVYKSNYRIDVLSDYTASIKDDEAITIINYSGDVLYDKVTEIKRYRNVSAITILEKEYLINTRGETILSDYTVEKEMYDVDDEDELLYLILKDTSNAYYYFDIVHEKIKGSEFVKYDELDYKNDLTVYRKGNGKVEKYTLSEYGDQLEDESTTQVKLVKDLKKIVDKKYTIYPESVYSLSQTKILVNNTEDNSFGTYEIKTKKYKKIYDYTSENGSSIVFNFDRYDGGKYLQISCQERYCGIDKVTVYDVVKGKVLFEYEAGENKIKDFTGFRGGYKVVKYTSDSSEEYANKYVLYNSKNNIITSSENMIMIVDRRITFGKKYKPENAIIYSAKLKKVLNTDDNLAIVRKVSKNRMYEYEDEDKVYLVSNKGNIIYEVKKSDSNLVYNKNILLDVSSKKVEMIDAKKNKVGSYKFEKNEILLTNSSQRVSSFKNSIFVNNANDNYGKIVDYSGNKIKKIKNSVIYEVNSSKESENIIIITKNNDKYGFYIAK